MRSSIYSSSLTFCSMFRGKVARTHDSPSSSEMTRDIPYWARLYISKQISVQQFRLQVNTFAMNSRLSLKGEILKYDTLEYSIFFDSVGSFRSILKNINRWPKNICLILVPY